MPPKVDALKPIQNNLMVIHTIPSY